MPTSTRTLIALAAILPMAATADPVDPARLSPDGAQLEIVVEPEALTVEFSTTWDELIGTASAVDAAADRHAIDEARVRLEDPGYVLQLASAAGCEIDYVETGDLRPEEGVDTTMRSDGGDADTAAIDTAVTMRYHFECADTEVLDPIDVVVGDTWPTLDALTVRMVGPDGLASTRLDHGTGRIDLTPVL